MKNQIIKIYDFTDWIIYILLFVVSLLVIIYMFYNIIFVDNLADNLLSTISIILTSLIVVSITFWNILSFRNNKINKIEIQDENIIIHYVQKNRKQITVIRKTDINKCELVIHISRSVRWINYDIRLDFIDENKDYIHLFHDYVSTLEVVRKIIDISSYIPNFSYQIYTEDCPLSKEYVKRICEKEPFKYFEYQKFLFKNLTLKWKIAKIFLLITFIFVIIFLIFNILRYYK